MDDNEHVNASFVVDLVESLGIDGHEPPANATKRGAFDREVVIDLSSPFVCLGTLSQADDHFLELRNADFHDLRDTKSTRENYVADSVRTGVKRNRKRVLISRTEVVAISRLEDVVDE